MPLVIDHNAGPADAARRLLCLERANLGAAKPHGGRGDKRIPVVAHAIDQRFDEPGRREQRVSLG